jgi:hypothetical protein
VAHEVLERGIGIGLTHDVERYFRIRRAALDDGSKATAGAWEQEPLARQLLERDRPDRGETSVRS